MQAIYGQTPKKAHTDIWDTTVVQNYKNMYRLIKVLLDTKCYVDQQQDQMKQQIVGLE
ncbi:hypothetical protein ACJX0J_032383, partial [Zea mays]